MVNFFEHFIFFFSTRYAKTKVNPHIMSPLLPASAVVSPAVSMAALRVERVGLEPSISAIVPFGGSRTLSTIYTIPFVALDGDAATAPSTKWRCKVLYDYLSDFYIVCYFVVYSDTSTVRF